MDRNETFHGHAILNSISGAKLLPFLGMARLYKRLCRSCCNLQKELLNAP